ncbi:Uncharacterized protein APZ42_029849 [Daphnia magna]|uniref:Uncharacterized protein n=1 Tax=Daphnia magna TaxID=35525 RepID=A0A164P9P5_9CRUS|nr:Uncharacterized protein APZ42_029849 [Daphnia magna]
MPGWMKKQNGAVAADWRQLERLYSNAVVDTKPSGGGEEITSGLCDEMICHHQTRTKR